MTPQQLASIHQAAFLTTRPWESDEFSSLLQSRFCFYVGDSSGFALGRVIAGETELLTLAVLPKFQRHGLGRKLLTAYHQAAKERAATQAFLEVAADNTPAINLYISDSYSETSRRKDYYKRLDGSVTDALLLTRDL